MAEEALSPSLSQPSSYPLETGRIYTFPGNKSRGEMDSIWTVQGFDQATGKALLVSIDPKTKKTVKKAFSASELQKKRALAGKIVDFRATTVSISGVSGQAQSAVSDGKNEYVEFNGTLNGRRVFSQLIPLALWKGVERGDADAIERASLFVDRVAQGDLPQNALLETQRPLRRSRNTETTEAEPTDSAKKKVTATGASSGAAGKPLAPVLAVETDDSEIVAEPAEKTVASVDERNKPEDQTLTLHQEIEKKLVDRRSAIESLRKEQTDLKEQTQIRLKEVQNVTEQKIKLFQDKVQEADRISQNIERIRTSDPNDPRLTTLQNELERTNRDLQKYQTVAQASQSLQTSLQASLQRQDAYAALMEEHAQDTERMLEDVDLKEVPEPDEAQSAASQAYLERVIAKRTLLDERGSFLRPEVGYSPQLQNDLQKSLEAESALYQASAVDQQRILDDQADELGEGGAKMVTVAVTQSYALQPASTSVQNYLDLMRQQSALRVRTSQRIPTGAQFRGSLSVPSAVQISGSIFVPAGVQGSIRVSQQVPTGLSIRTSSPTSSTIGGAAAAVSFGLSGALAAPSGGVMPDLSGLQNQLTVLEQSRTQIASELEALLDQRRSFAEANNTSAMARTDVAISEKMQALKDVTSNIEAQRAIILDAQKNATPSSPALTLVSSVQQPSVASLGVPLSLPNASAPPGFAVQDGNTLGRQAGSRSVGIPGSSSFARPRFKGGPIGPEDWVQQYNLRPIQMAQGAKNALNLYQAQQASRLAQAGVMGRDESLGDTRQSMLASEGGQQGEPLLALDRVDPFIQPASTNLYAESGDEGVEDESDLSPVQRQQAESRRMQREGQRQGKMKSLMFGAGAGAGLAASGFGGDASSTQPNTVPSELEVTRGTLAAPSTQSSATSPALTSAELDAQRNQAQMNLAVQQAAMEEAAAQEEELAASGAGATGSGGGFDFDKMWSQTADMWNAVTGALDGIGLIMLLTKYNLMLTYTYVEMPFIPLLVYSIDGKINKAAQGASKQDKQKLKLKFPGQALVVILDFIVAMNFIMMVGFFIAIVYIVANPRTAFSVAWNALTSWVGL